jgi:hypothetical protein
MRLLFVEEVRGIVDGRVVFGVARLSVNLPVLPTSGVVKPDSRGVVSDKPLSWKLGIGRGASHK